MKMNLNFTEKSLGAMRLIFTLDFFLWGYMKHEAYADALQLIQELKEKIRDIIDEI